MSEYQYDEIVSYDEFNEAVDRLQAGDKTPFLLLSKEVAAELGITPRQLSRLRASGKGPPYCRLFVENGPIRYPRPRLEEWKAAQSVK